MIPDFLVHEAADVVGVVVVEGLKSGQEITGWVMKEDETVSVVEVGTGLDDGHRIEILSGLEPGQNVVDAHLKRFSTGDKVTLLTR